MHVSKHSLLNMNRKKRYTRKLKNKGITGSGECSPTANCLLRAVLVIQHFLFTHTWQRYHSYAPDLLQCDSKTLVLKVENAI